MKFIYLYISIVLFVFVSCSKKTGDAHEGHNHATKEVHSHAEGEVCTGDHSGEETEAEDHNHASEENAPQEEAETHGDEIVMTPAQMKAGGVVAKSVEPKSFAQVIRTSGKVLSAQGDEKVVVATSSGIVNFGRGTLLAGSAVKQGGVLLSISGKKMIEGDAAERLRIDYNRAKKEYERAEKLVKDKIISDKEFESVKRDYDAARIAYSAAGVQSSGSGVAVTAPLSGFIKNCTVRDGEYVAAGTPLLTVSQNKRLTLQAEVSERHYSELSNIRSAKFKTPYKNEVFDISLLNGRLVSVGRTSSDNNYYIPVSFEFDNKGNVIPGSYVEVYLQTQPIQEAIVLPLSAITEEQGLYFVYKQVDAEGFKRLPVTLGENNGDEVQVLSGVHPGDKIVVQGAYQVKLASASGAIPEGHSHNH